MMAAKAALLASLVNKFIGPPISYDNKSERSAQSWAALISRVATSLGKKSGLYAIDCQANVDQLLAWHDAVN
ncbi:MAG: hypothetical protein LCH86_22840 [Proteobacteria bacterium]|nr:hypothetical protein [Pseudomonadota bacterium]